MDDLKTMLDGQQIAVINKNIYQFLHTGDGYGNKLKYTFVLLNLIEESAKLLGSVDYNDFTSQVKQRIDEIEKQTKTLTNAYSLHLKQNNEIVDVLTSRNNQQLSELQQQIQSLLSKYDEFIKPLLEERERLPMTDILQQQPR